MKLKYYLRGLGIGIVVTALLMGFATRERLPLTDAEIKARARALGMVESDSVQLSDIRQPGSTQSDRDTPENQEPEESREPEESKEPEESREPEGSKEPEESREPEGSKEPEESQSTNPSEEESYVTIVVNKGYSSETVSRILAEAGLVEDAGAFDRYLVNAGYATRIRIGTYRILMGTSRERIAQIIIGAE